MIGSRAPLRYLIYYDTAAFIAVSAVIASLLATARARGTLEDEWQYRMALVGARIGHALCAFPYFFASIYPWKLVITHAKETGYTREGRCVPRKRDKEYAWVADATARAADDDDGADADEAPELRCARWPPPAAAMPAAAR